MKELIPDEQASRFLRYARRNREKFLEEKRIERARRKKEGLCYTCGNQAEVGKTLCTSHREQNAASNKKCREVRMEKGRCGHCKDGDPIYDRGPCLICWLKTKSRDNLGTEKKWQELRDKLVSQNFTCPYTGEKLVPGKNASVDHIYPSSVYPELEYDINNVEWVDMRFNRVKFDLNPDQFYHLCLSILTRRYSDKLGLELTLLLSSKLQEVELSSFPIPALMSPAIAFMEKASLPIPILLPSETK